MQENENPRKIEHRHTRPSFLENLLKTKRRKTIAVNDNAIYALEIDKPNQNDIKIKKIITRVR